TQIYSINFAIVDAPIWPGSLGMYNPSSNITIVNYPFQIFGVSEIAFFDILVNNTVLTIDLQDYSHDFVTDSNAIMIEPFNNTITGLEVFDNYKNLSFSSLNTIGFGDSLDVYFRFNNETQPFPLYDMTLPLIALFDNNTNMLFGLSLLEWDNSIDKYHSKFIIMEDVKDDGVENYDLKLVYISTEVETQVNSTQGISIDLIAQTISQISLKNEREVIFNPDYSFTLNTKFNINFGEEWHILGYILDNSTYYRTREIIPYNATDPIGAETITEYPVDLHGLIGDSEFVDRDNFLLEYIDRENFNEITPLYEVVNGSVVYQDYRIMEAWIDYYAYYRTDYPNQFMLIINWTAIEDDLIYYNTDFLLTYKVMQGKKIVPAVFEAFEKVAVPVDFRQFSYDTFEWESQGWTNREILNTKTVQENSTLFINIVQDQTIQV
ncbi:hypothetical protein LCGC14_2701540, partial [marine sediment metagenome]